jgi:hypothetical protein
MRQLFSLPDRKTDLCEKEAETVSKSLFRVKKEAETVAKSRSGM